MKKDKEWLKEAVGELNLVVTEFEADGMCYMDRAVSVTQVYDLIDQLDESEVLSQEWIDKNVIHIRGLGDVLKAEDVEGILIPNQELPVIPQFVADEFDYNKKPYWEVDEAKDVAHILKCAFGNEGKPSEFLDWVRENPEDYVMAVRNGYEVKKEKLYYVLDKQGKTLLVLMGGEVRISGGYVLSESTATKDIYQLTEKQIKDYDERFWEFAVEVQE